ncbi:MAG: ASCH domain-containing protein [Bacteroidota bacterium]
MLFKQYYLEGIKRDEIALAYRKWKKAAVREGSLLNTAIGQIKIGKVDRVNIQSITEPEARKAGLTSLDELLDLLGKVKEGNVYRIEVIYHGPDPRVELRNKKKLTEKEFNHLAERLRRLDRYSKVGAWTSSTLMAIQANPKLRAADLAILLSTEKEWLKLNIRKLKNLGLTISHNPGYVISPLGAQLLKRMSTITAEKNRKS